MITATIFGNLDDVERCVKFLVLKLLLELLPMSRLTLHMTRPGNRSVIFQSHPRHPRSKRLVSAQCSSNSHQAIRAPLQISTSQTAAALKVVPKSVPMTGCIQRVVLQVLHLYSVTTILRSNHCFSTVVTVVVAGSTLCFFTVSLSLPLFVPVLGGTTPSCALSLSTTTVTAAWHTTHLASHACSCKFTLLPAVARRTCDVSSKRLEYPPLASMRVILTDGSPVPPSAQTSTCVASLVQVTPDIQPHRSSAPKDHAGAWADELVLDTHVASMALLLGGKCCSFFTRRRQLWCLCPCVHMRDCAE